MACINAGATGFRVVASSVYAGVHRRQTRCPQRAAGKPSSARRFKALPQRDSWAMLQTAADTHLRKVGSPRPARIGIDDDNATQRPGFRGHSAQRAPRRFARHAVFGPIFQ